MTIPGSHYCERHQGNTSHYAEENCLVCQLKEALWAIIATPATNAESTMKCKTIATKALADAAKRED